MMLEKDNDSKALELVRLNSRHPFALRIGSGVGSEIFLAMQQGEGDTFQRLVAVKKVAALFDGSGQNELMREIRAAAGLSHPNIVRIYGVEKSGARLLVSMEYVYGHRLSTLLTAMRERQLLFPLPILLRMMVQACEALHHAHSASGLDKKPLKLVHRDVCPENIMLDIYGYLRIVDFGLAKLAGAEDTTIPGRVKGRFLYMPLEQMQGDTLDNRSDIFSLGMTFYELATLQSPRKARNIKAAYDEAVSNHTVPPISTIWSCPPEVDALFMKATATLPDERFQTAREFSVALEKIAGSNGGLASIGDTEAWLESSFPDLKKRRESLEESFSTAVEKAGNQNLQVSPPAPRLEEDIEAIEDIDDGENATRWLIMGLLAFLAIMIGFATHFMTRERESVRFSEGFQIENDLNEASVFVLSIPARSTLYVDGELVGKVSRLGVTVTLEPGKKHRLRLELPGYETFKVSVDGQAGIADQVIAQLQRVGKPKVKASRGKTKLAEKLTLQNPQEELVEQPLVQALVEADQSELREEIPVKKAPVSAQLKAKSRGLHPVEWGMNKKEVGRILAGVLPARQTQRVDSYRGQFYGQACIQNFIYLDSGLGAVIYLLPQSEETAALQAFEEVLGRLESDLGSPEFKEQPTGREWRIHWRDADGEVLLVWNSKKTLSKALKVMYLSMPWIELQKQLGNVP